MILYTIIAIGIFIYTVFAKGFLIDSIKNLDEYNKGIEKKSSMDAQIMICCFPENMTREIINLYTRSCHNGCFIMFSLIF